MEQTQGRSLISLPQESFKPGDETYDCEAWISQKVRFAARSLILCSLCTRESEYKKKLRAWGVRKNGTTSAWVFVQREVAKRKLQGKEDYEVLMHGKIYTAKQAEREMARHVTYTTTYFTSEGELSRLSWVG